MPPALEVVFEGGALTFPANGVTNAYPASLLSPSAKLGFVVAANGAASGCYEMTTEAQAGFWPIGITMSIAARPAKDLRFPIFRIPTSVRTVTKDDFYVSSLTPYEEELTVETEGGMQTVYLSFPEVMTATRVQNSAPCTVWKRGDGTTVTNAEDAAYAYFTDRNGSGSNQFRIDTLSDPFAGKSLSVIGANASNFSHFYFRKSDFDRTVNDFRLYPFVRLGHLAGNSDLTFRGKMSVHSTETSPVIFEATKNNGGSLDVRSSLAGDGYLKIALLAGTARSATFGLKGDNSRFVGTLDFSWARVGEVNDSGVFVDPADNSLTNYLDVALGDGTSLGGELPTFNAKAVRVRGANGLTVTEDVLVSCTNRGFYFADVPRVSVADGKTFAIASTSTFAGTLTKSGAGALKLAGVTAETPAAGANAVTVEAGALELTKPWAVSNVAFDVTDADSTTLRLSRTAVGTQGLVNTVDDAPFGTSGTLTLAWADGEGLALEPRTMRKAQIPLMTVKATAAAALVQRIVVPTGSGSYQLRMETDGDVATIYVDAELKPGLIFVVK